MKPTIKVTAKFEPRDVWIGLYWTADKYHVKFFICILPLFPIIITKTRCTCIGRRHRHLSQCPVQIERNMY